MYWSESYLAIFQENLRTFNGQVRLVELFFIVVMTHECGHWATYPSHLTSTNMAKKKFSRGLPRFCRNHKPCFAVLCTHTSIIMMTTEISQTQATDITIVGYLNVFL